MDDCRRVAAQVQLLTTADATNPDLTVLPAVENISDVWTSCWYLSIRGLVEIKDTDGRCTYLFNAQVMKIITNAKANPKPTAIPYPKLWLKGTVK